MSDPFVGEIRIVPFNFAPRGWAFCDGQLLPLTQNTALFSLLGTTYGGDGKSNFALPNLQGRAPMQAGQGPGLSLRDLGEASGEENVFLIESEIPSHIHVLQHGSLTAHSQSDPSGALPGQAAGRRGGLTYGMPSGAAAMDASALTPAGASQPHNNMQPYLTMNYIIALQGIFPPRS